MKANLGLFLKTSCGLAGVVAVMLISVRTANANIYQWNGSTSTNWSTAANWSSGGTLTAGPAATGVSSNHRLNVTNSANYECVYTAALGTTVYGSNNLANPIAANGVRGLVIGSIAPGVFRIVGGSFSSANQSNPTNNPDILGNGNNVQTSSFIIDGGSYTSGASGLSIGNTSGSITGNLNLNGGTATITTLSLDGANANVNLNTNGTLVANLITNFTVGAAGSPVAGYSRIFNFNGGTLVAGKTTRVSWPACLCVRMSVTAARSLIPRVLISLLVSRFCIHPSVVTTQLTVA